MGIFTVLWMVLKQIFKNWRLELILLVGLILAVAVSSCISIYTDGVLQMVMLEKWQSSSSQLYPPGAIKITDEQWYDYHPILSDDQWRDQEEAFQQYLALDQLLYERVPEVFNTELLHFSKIGRTDKESIQAENPVEEQRQRFVDLAFLTGLKDKVEVIAGRWFNEKESTGDIDILDGEVIEVVIDENARHELNLKVGNVYLYPLISEKYEEERFLRLKVVGVFRVKRDYYNSPVWVESPPYSSTIFMSEDVYENLILRDDTRPYIYSWYFNLDYKSVRFHELTAMIRRLNRLETEMGNISGTTRMSQSSLGSLRPLVQQADLLKKLLLILSLPILGMIFYYIILAASLTIQRRSNEIALLRSRGAGLLQILMTYLLEWGFLGLSAFFIGPRLGLIVARLMGASSGFLTFVNRNPIPVIIPPDAYFYVIMTIAAALLSCLLLVIPAARESIVSYKHNIARNKNKPFWQKYYLDLVLLLFSIYGYRELLKQISLLESGGAEGSQLMLDPMLFLIPVLFLATAGLLSLRIIPWILRLLSLLIEKLPEVSITVTLRQFFRNTGQYSPLIFFIIMTVSLGIYSSSIARTLNQNFTDSLMYEYGTDVVISEKWSFDSVSYGEQGQMLNNEGSIVYEPPFYIHKELAGVEDAARVLTKKGNVIIGSKRVGRGTLMAIDPVDFANVTWFRDDLANQHLHFYMNRLTDNRLGALVNREFYEENELSPGDWVSFNLGTQSVDFFVAGVVDLWPSIYPRSFPLIIGNLSYVQQQYIIEPYDVWLRLEENASLQAITDELQENNIWVTNIQDSRTEIIEGRREPQRMGLYGMLSIGFVVAVLITVMGFFLYNFLSLKSRILQFGVMRAIGLSISQLISILCLEQFLTVGIGFMLGTTFGIIASRVFLPFLQISQNLEGVVPGFRIVVQRSDIINILIILGGTLIIGLVFLGFILVKLKLHEAIKLGEEV
ncbi:MAG: FtsX-like permease family protein [Halanaerobiales bacterium]